MLSSTFLDFLASSLCLFIHSSNASLDVLNPFSSKHSKVNSNGNPYVSYSLNAKSPDISLVKDSFMNSSNFLSPDSNVLSNNISSLWIKSFMCSFLSTKFV